MKMLPWEIAQTKTRKDGKYKILSIFREKEVQSNPNQTSRRNTTQLNKKPYKSQNKNITNFKIHALPSIDPPSHGE